MSKMPNANYAVLGSASKRGGNWYILAAIQGYFVTGMGYVVWEWHDELGKFFRTYYVRLLRFARIRK